MTLIRHQKSWNRYEQIVDYILLLWLGSEVQVFLSRVQRSYQNEGTRKPRHYWIEADTGTSLHITYRISTMQTDLSITGSELPIILWAEVCWIWYENSLRREMHEYVNLVCVTEVCTCSVILFAWWILYKWLKQTDVIDIFSHCFYIFYHCLEVSEYECLSCFVDCSTV